MKEIGFFLCLSSLTPAHQIISEDYSISNPCGVVRFKGGTLAFPLIAHALAKKAAYVQQSTGQ